MSFAPDILLIVGGVPINFAGNFYGGVGVAGARPVKKKFLCRTYDGEIIGRKTSEDSPKEEVFEGASGILSH